MNEPTGLYIMAVLYIIAGIMHFIKPKMYMRIMPKYLPNHKALVLWSGAVEIVFGIGLFFAEFRDLALVGIIAMLFVFLLVHVFMLTNKESSTKIPKWILILRVPLQFVLMYWAWVYL